MLQERHDVKHDNKSEKNMSDMFYAVDADHSGQISKEECKSSL